MIQEIAANQSGSPLTAFSGRFSNRTRNDQFRVLGERKNPELLSREIGNAVSSLVTFDVPDFMKMSKTTGRVLVGFGVFGLAVGVAISIFSPHGGRSSVEAAAVPTVTPVPRISYKCVEVVNPRVDTNPSDGRYSDALLLARWKIVYKRGPRSDAERISDYKLEDRMGAGRGTIVVIDQNVQVTDGDCEIKNTNY